MGHYPPTSEKFPFHNNHQKQFRMKRVKWTIMSLTIILSSVSVAFTAKPKCFTCQQMDQYWYNGTSYQYVGEVGIDYNCAYPGTICTYTTKDYIHYTPCNNGYTFQFIIAP
jgi:hypothetical protein